MRKKMYPAFAYKINDRFELMPLFLKIICGATFLLGAFQLLALIFPVLSPRIEGTTISSPILMVLMGSFHIVISYGIYNKQRWSMPLIVFSPVFQYSILYLDTGLPKGEVLKINFSIVISWAAFFTIYFMLGRAKSYFKSDSENSA